MKKWGAFAVLLLIAAIVITACGPTYYIPYPIPTPDKTDDGNVANDDWYDGNESASGTYVLRTVGDILGFAELVENGTTFKGQTVELVAGQVYDFSEVDNFSGIGNGTWAGYNNFDSLSESARPFMGVFDGKGATIMNLNMEYESSDSNDATARGFFDMIYEAEIKNLIFVNANVVGEGKPTGVAVGFSVNSKLSGIQVSGSSVEGGQGTGGVVGSAFFKEMSNTDAITTVGRYLGIENCSVQDTDILANGANAGGIAGQIGDGMGVQGQSGANTGSYFRNNKVSLNADNSIKANANAAGGFIGYSSWWNVGTQDISNNRLEIVSSDQITAAVGNSSGYFDGGDNDANISESEFTNNNVSINGTESKIIFYNATPEDGQIANIIS